MKMVAYYVICWTNLRTPREDNLEVRFFYINNFNTESCTPDIECCARFRSLDLRCSSVIVATYGTVSVLCGDCLEASCYRD